MEIILHKEVSYFKSKTPPILGTALLRSKLFPDETAKRFFVLFSILFIFYSMNHTPFAFRLLPFPKDNLYRGLRQYPLHTLVGQ